LPGVKEDEDVLRGHRAGRFKFAAFLTEEEFAVGIKNSEGGDTTVEWDIVFLGDIEILVHLADVHVDDKEGFVEGGGDFGTVKSFVKDVAIETPVAAEDEENALVRSGSSLERLGNFGVRAKRRIVDLLRIERLAESCGRSALDDEKRPAVVLTEPALDNGDEFLFGGGILLESKGELKNEKMEVGLRVTFPDEISREPGEALRFPGRPEGQFVGESNGLAVKAGKLRFGGLTVKTCESGKIAGEDGGAPLVKRREGKAVRRTE